MVTLDINGKATRVDAEPASFDCVRSRLRHRHQLRHSAIAGQGSVGHALSAAFYGAIALADGVVEQSDFHGYAAIRIAEMPMANDCIMPLAEKRTGVGEPAVPPVVPAAANAIAAAMDRRVRRLPINVQKEVR